MRMLRWASEKAVDTNERVAEVGVAALTALSESELLQEEDVRFIDLVTDAIIGPKLEEVMAAGDDAEVVEEGST